VMWFKEHVWTERELEDWNETQRLNDIEDPTCACVKVVSSVRGINKCLFFCSETLLTEGR
jgi:hypothetical protein